MQREGYERSLRRVLTIMDHLEQELLSGQAGKLAVPGEEVVTSVPRGLQVIERDRKPHIFLISMLYTKLRTV
jgi:hypothetical protein